MIKKMLPLLIAASMPHLAHAAMYGGIDFPAGLDSFADGVVTSNVVVGTNGPPLSAQDTTRTLGAPDYNSGDFVNSACTTNPCKFLTLGNGGSVTVEFTNNFLTGSGDAAHDLWIFEVGPRVEDCNIEISKDGITWFDVGYITGATAGIDIDQYGFDQTDQFTQVRITDVWVLNENAEWTGADIDAVGALSSAPAVVGIPPVADAGIDQSVDIATPVALDGSGSYDPDNNVPITYHWGFVSVPAGSTAVLSGENTVNPSFTPDVCGIYTLVLFVTDDEGDISVGDTVEIESVEIISLIDVLDFGEDNGDPLSNPGSVQAGTILSSVYGANGTGPVTVNGINPDFPADNAAVIFNSMVPTGQDPDLGTPNETIPPADTIPPFLASQPGEGAGGEDGATYENYIALYNVLIVAEDLVNNDADDLVDDPDDQTGYGTIELDFSAVAPVTVYTADIIDIDSSETHNVAYFDINDNQLSSYAFPQPGDNGVAYDHPIPQTGVHKMVLAITGSGAVDNIRFKDESATNSCAAPTVLDSDADGYADGVDNCPTDYNPGQEDTDGDTEGDVCDPTPAGPPVEPPVPEAPPQPGARSYSVDSSYDLLLMLLLACGLFYGRNSWMARRNG